MVSGLHSCFPDRTDDAENAIKNFYSYLLVYYDGNNAQNLNYCIFNGGYFCIPQKQKIQVPFLSQKIKGKILFEYPRLTNLILIRLRIWELPKLFLFNL